MVKKTGGTRRKTRSKYRKVRSEKGKVRIRDYFQEFQINDHVALVTNPTIHSAMPHRRFHGKNGVITGKQGKVYKVQVKDGNMRKILLVHPVHLRRQ